MKLSIPQTPLSLLKMSFKTFLESRFQLIGRLSFYVMTVLIFSQLWMAVLSLNAEGSSYRMQDMVRYIAVTESAVLSEPYVFNKIEGDIRSGDISYFLARSLSYLSLRFYEGMGIFLINFPFFILAGVVTATLLTGEIDFLSEFFLLSLFISVISCALSILIQIVIGLCAFWLEDISSVGIIYRKLMYLLGGLLLPLSMYPSIIQTLAYLTPFPWMIYHRSSLIYSHNFDDALLTCLMLCFWSGGAFIVLNLLFTKCLNKISINGG